MQKPSKFSRRDVIRCPIFGDPKDFGLMLPTHWDLILCCSHVRWSIGHESEGNKEPSFSIIAERVAVKVEGLYEKASIPTVSHKRVLDMIHAYHRKYVLIKSSFRRAKESANIRAKVEKFKEDASTLFDISACKCHDFNQCICPKERKVPLKEQEFLVDQRNSRQMIIGSVDIAETEKLKKRIARKVQDSLRQVGQASLNTPKLVSDEGTDNEAPDNAQVHDLYLPNNASPSASTSQMRIKLTNTALTSQRFGVSNRAAAALATSVLKDLGLISELSTSLVTDKNKIAREKARTRKELKTKSFASQNLLKGLYFDGRHDLTLVQEKYGGKYYRRTITEDHYSLVREPGSQYVGHVTPKSGSALEISESISEYVSAEVPGGFSELLALGSDGTIVNTGANNGVIRRLELKLNKPLQWIICLLHFNELPLRHLFEFIDGKTTGPKSYSGSIGKQLQDCQELPVVCFKAVDANSELPLIDSKILSKDQQYLFECFHAVKSGVCPPALAKRDPGPLNMSRWLTTANRLLRLYMATQIPSTGLSVLVEFILRVYIPSWFNIKVHNSVAKGSKILWDFIHASRYLPKKYIQVVDPVIARNAFFAAPENILLGMVTDERAHVRELGIRRILKARDTTEQTGVVRCFIVPELNFQATDYIDLIHWSTCKVTSPPLLNGVCSDVLQGLLLSKAQYKWDFIDFPCHTQAVERTVKLVTEASSNVCGAENRDGYIRATLESRRMMPIFDCKGDYKPMEQH